MSASARSSPRLSVQEFLTWESGDYLRYALVDGTARAMAPASTIHALLQGRLATMITTHLDAHHPGCRLLVAPGIVPRLLSAHNFRSPDLGVTCAPVVPGQATVDSPVLLIEILSPSNEGATWSNVRAYTSVPSVQEILVLHSTRMAAELLRRGPEGWPEEPDQLRDGDLELTSIGFRRALAEIYAQTGLKAQS